MDKESGPEAWPGLPLLHHVGALEFQDGLVVGREPQQALLQRERQLERHEVALHQRAVLHRVLHRNPVEEIQHVTQVTVQLQKPQERPKMNS